MRTMKVLYIFLHKFYRYSFYVWVYDPLCDNFRVWYEVELRIHFSQAGAEFFQSYLSIRLSFTPLYYFENLLENRLTVYRYDSIPEHSVSLWTLPGWICSLLPIFSANVISHGSREELLPFQSASHVLRRNTKSPPRGPGHLFCQEQ